MLRLLTGRNRALGAALTREISAALRNEGDALYVVVPKQLTLETELFLLEGLSLQGSFRLRVLSPERLCGLIFDAAGRPEGARVDDRGRVMLVSRAMKDIEGELTLYRGAQTRRGFALRAAKQVEVFRQAGMGPEEVRACAAREHGALSRKLEDVAAILAAYEREMAGRFEDGEGELTLAAERAAGAAFLRGARLWFYGFDMMPPTLHGLIAAVAEMGETTVLLPLEMRAQARDGDIFLPLRASAMRLVKAARMRNVEVVFAEAGEGEPLPDELRFLSTELFSTPARGWEDAPRRVQLFEARSPREEARFAAALTRRLARARGWRYRDVRLLVPSLDAYREPLRAAFAECGIPLFLAESRPCARRPLCECLLTALQMLTRGAREEDLHACLSSGCLDISRHEAARLRNYAISWGLRASAFFQPLKRGPAELVEALEPVRARAMAPLISLRERLRAARDLRGQLEAVFGFLTDIRACERSLARQEELCAQNMYEEAGEEAQVWNRVVGALDQMAALLGEKKLPVREIAERLAEALDAAVVKPLPQSGDAVLAQDVAKLSMRPARAVLLLGQVERAAGAADMLLTDRQLEAVSQSAERYVGLTAAEAARTRLFYAKAALEMATDYVCISYPLAGIDGAAERPGPLVAQLRRAFPGLRARGGVVGDESAEAMMLEAPFAALPRVAAALSGEMTAAQQRALTALARLPETRKYLSGLREALALRAAVDRLRPETARALYGGLRTASVSRLESFAACPFTHFLNYGIKPEIIEPYALTPRDEGVFFHAAVRGLLGEMMDGGDYDPDRACARMERVAETLLAPLREGPLGQSARTRAEEKRLKGVARTAARLLAEQLCDSRFRPVGLEVRFGPDDGDACLRVGAGRDCALYGSIDRVDLWEGERPYARVLDYKRGSQPFSLAEAWAGLQLQLLIYLAAAAKKRGALAAGAFYFRLGEGYILTPETDPMAVAEARRKALRMDGPMLDDEAALAANSAEPKRFFKAGSPLSRAAFDKLIDRAVAMASAHVDGIRAGEAAPGPARVGKELSCRFCKLRAACLFDAGVDRERVRRVTEDKSAVLMQLEAEEEHS